MKHIPEEDPIQCKLPHLLEDLCYCWKEGGVDHLQAGHSFPEKEDKYEWHEVIEEGAEIVPGGGSELRPQLLTLGGDRDFCGSL
jgi:hypothetical protein